MTRRQRTLAAPALLAAATLALSACGSGTGTATGSGTGSGTGGAKIAVIAAFYPLEYAVQRVGGDAVTVTNLTKPGAEPHDAELTPQDVAKLSEAPLTVYLKGFQPALDKAVADRGKAAYDVSPDARLTAPAPDDDHAHETGSSTHDDHGANDPHFWLDPTRYAGVVTALAAKLGQVDPAHKDQYEQNAKAFVADLDALDKEYEAGLASCTNRTLVTGHAAFGYLAERYKLTQHAISGLTPEAEPAAARLAEIATYVKANKVKTIYTETLVSPAVAQTVARETGAQTAVLDPIEGLSTASAGSNYGDLMRANLAALKKGQPCS